MRMTNARKILKFFEEAVITLRKYLHLLKDASRMSSSASVFGKWTVLPLTAVTIIDCIFKNTCRRLGTEHRLWLTVRILFMPPAKLTELWAS